MRTALKPLALAGILAVSPAAVADELSYTFFDFGYVTNSLDEPDVDGDGFGVRASARFDEWLFATGSYQRPEYDLDLKIETWDIGLGVPWSLRENLDVYGVLSYVNVEASIPDPAGGSSRLRASDSGLGVTAGVRWLPLHKLEATAAARFVDLEESETSFTAGVRYYIAETSALVGDVIASDDGLGFFIGLRLDFGRDPFR